MKTLEILMAVCVLLSSIFVSGCNSNTVADLVITLGNAASSVAALEGNSSLSTKLTADVATAATDIKNWKTGSPTQEVVEALNLVQADLSLFPQTDQYAPLIALSISTVESILEIVVPNPTTAFPHTNADSVARAKVSAPAPKTARDFKNRWNAIVAANPNLNAAKL
jgi:hypothetical protein